MEKTKFWDKDSVQEHMSKIREDLYKIEVEVMEGGKLPNKKNASDAGFDLCAVEDVVILPGQSMKVPLNIRLKLPQGTYATITGKSGLGAQGLLVHAGIIDELYRGIPHVVMANVNIIQGIDEQGYPLMRTQPIVVKKGEKLAQLIMAPYSPHYFINQVDKVDTNTDRAEGGFGSTGK
jgi:dUTP pyrophosphatase